jgi:hypothetical protein
VSVCLSFRVWQSQFVVMRGMFLFFLLTGIPIRQQESYARDRREEKSPTTTDKETTDDSERFATASKYIITVQFSKTYAVISRGDARWAITRRGAMVIIIYTNTRECRSRLRAVQTTAGDEKMWMMLRFITSLLTCT